MAFPLIPIAVVALIAMAAGGKKKKRRPVVVPPPDNGYEGEDYAFGDEDFVDQGEEIPFIDVLPEDSIRFEFTQQIPYEWALYSEAVEGSPVLVVTEEVVTGYGPPGTPNHYIADVLVEPGVGIVAMDFVMMGPGQTVGATKKVFIRVS